MDVVCGKRPERTVEHANDLGRLVVDAGLLLFIPQHRDGGAAAVERIGEGIDFVQIGCAVERVTVGAGVVAEAPALIGQARLDYADRYDVIETFELAHEQRPGRPWAGQSHVEVVASCFGREAAFARRAGTAVARNPVAKLRLLPHEAALGVLGLYGMPTCRPFPVHKHAVVLRRLPAAPHPRRARPSTSPDTPPPPPPISPPPPPTPT